MLKIVLRGVMVRRLQFILAALAIVIGVGFVSGTFVLAQSVHSTYDRLLSEVTAGIDVYVRGPETDRHQGLSDFASLPQSMVEQLAGLHDVAAAQGQVVRLGQLVTVKGKFLNPGRPTYALSWPASASLSPFVLVSGRAPLSPGEVVLDRSTAQADGFVIGSALRISVDIVTPLPAHVVGIAAPREGGDLSDSSTVFLNAQWAQSIVGIGQQWDLIELKAIPGVSADQLRDHVAAVIPHNGTSAITSRQYADATVQDLNRDSDSVTTILLALSILAVLICGAVILNTFGVLVAQRRREIALLRSIGLTPHQVYGSVLGEAAILGLVASAAGAVLGIPASFALRGLVGLVGENVSSAQLDVEPMTILLAIVIGTAATVAIAVRPAWLASRVPPTAALREAAVVITRGPGRRFAIACSAAATCGVALVVLGLAGPDADRVALVASGGSLSAVALLASLPLVARPMLGLLGGLASRSGAAGAVARMEMRRNPRRAIGPAGALVAGLGLLTGISVVAASAQTSIDTLVQRTDRAAYVVTSDAAPGIDPEAVEKLREAPAIGVVSMMGAESATVDGTTTLVTALEPETDRSVLALRAISGNVADLSDTSVLVTQSAAVAGNYHVGQYVSVRFGEPQVQTLKIVAVIQDNGITNDWTVSWDTYSVGYNIPTIRAAFITAASGASPLRLQREVQFGIAGFPGIQVLNAVAYSQQQAQRIDGPVALVDALVGLAILIALLWVVNTLALSVVERAPALRLLRLVGMTPGQLAMTVRWEAVMIAVLGAVIGIAAGLVFGVALVEALRLQGITEIVVPVLRIAEVTAVVVIAAVLAAALPARQAARIGAGKPLAPSV